MAGRKGRLYADRDWMYENYVGRGMTMREVASAADCGLRTVARWLRKHDIPARQDWDRCPPSGEDHWNWKGGRITDGSGYIQVLVRSDSPYFPMARTNTNGPDSGYVAEHRLAMAESLGRPLRNDETVHHIDGDRQNNEINNLQLRTGNHGNGVVLVCGDCGSNDIQPVQIGR